MLELLRNAKEDLAIRFKFKGKRYKANAFGLAWWTIVLGQGLLLTTVSVSFSVLIFCLSNVF